VSARSPRPGSARKPGVAAPVLVVALLLVAGAALDSDRASGPTGAGSGTVPTGGLSLASSQLGAASASLARGEGPALGHPLSCQAGEAGSYRCATHPPASSNSSGVGWSEIPNIPFSRAGALLAYDAADGYVVMFGGQILTEYTESYNVGNETWTYVGGSWTNLTPTLSVAPPSEPGGVLVYDGLDQYLVLQTSWWHEVNGTTVQTPQTWTFSAGHWALLHPSASPGVLLGGSAVYDSGDGYVVLFGGSNSRSTWTFAHGNWSVLSTSVAPWARTGAIMVYDPAGGNVLLSGGEATISGNQVDTNDTWTFHAGNWTQVSPEPSFAPTQKGGLIGATDDPGSGAILAFVYCAYGTGVYQYDNGSWSNVDSCGTMQALGGVTYDGADQEVLTYAGYEGYDFSNPTWLSLYSFSNGTFTVVSSPPDIPPADSTGVLADDGGDGYLVYYDQGGTMTSTGTTWLNSPSHVEPSASQCSGGAMTYDAHDGYVLLFCGQTWEYQNGSWSQAVQGVSDDWPSASNGPSVTYDGKDGYVLLFGGAGHDETWTWSGGNWTNLSGSVGVAPSPRIYASLCYDPVDGYVVLFGGLTPSFDAASNETWTFSAGAWNELRPAQYPAARGGAMMAFDAALGYALLFGGMSGVAGPGGVAYFGDTWEFLGGNWTDVTSAAPAPAPRSDGAIADASETGQIVLLGGSGEYYANPSEWTWGTAAPPPAPQISGFSSSPSTTDVNASTTIRVTVLGGAPPLSYNYSGLPAGCASADDRSIVCVPTTTGTFQVGVEVSDTDLRTANATATLVVYPRPAISVFRIAPSVILLGEITVLTVNWSGGSPPLSVSYIGLPAGCSAETVGMFECQPTESGEFTITATVADHRGVMVSAVAELEVESPSSQPPLNLTGFTIQPSAITLGNSTVVSTVTTGGLGLLTFAYAGLPPGCPSSHASAFFCTPTVSGEFTVTVSVTDQTPVTVRGAALLLVEPASTTGSTPSPPVVTGFTATPSELIVGQPLVLWVTASGGAPPYTYEYANLPGGCASANTSTLSCTPTVTGEFEVTVTVSDSGGRFDQRITTLTIEAPPPPTLPTPPTPPSVTTPPSTAGMSISIVYGTAAAAAVLLASLGVLWSLRRKS
jgi:hypothetical protein